MSRRPSQLRIFCKSMFVFAGGWLLSVGWLWVAGVQQHLLRHGEAPADYGIGIVTLAVVPSALIALCGIAMTAKSGRAPEPSLERTEWWHAFWWSVVPNWLLFTSVWVMIREGR